MRPEVKARYPLHIVMRALPDVGSLRLYETYLAIREATNVALGWGESFRIIHYSIQHTHLHLIVEALDRKALWRGMHAFGISCARQINAALTARHGVKRAGAVFGDRYFARALRNPRAVRNCLSYVLNNWRHHGEHTTDRTRSRRAWKIDPLSSAFAFDGWRERPDRTHFKIPPDYEGGVVWTPSTWLLREGWRRHGLVSVLEVPGGQDE